MDLKFLFQHIQLMKYISKRQEFIGRRVYVLHVEYDLK